MRKHGVGSSIGFVFVAAFVAAACSSGSGTAPDASALDAAPEDAGPDASKIDGTTDAITESGACPQGQFLVYVHAGCGVDAHATCEGPEDACIVDVCNCDGTPGIRCDYSSKPFAHDGPCGDASIDGAVDAKADDVTTDAIVDSGPCPPGEYLGYVHAGCGADAHATCQGPGDACIIEVCNCDGTPGIRCDYSNQPFAHDGPCMDASLDGAAIDDAAIDASLDGAAVDDAAIEATSDQ